MGTHDKWIKCCYLYSWHIINRHSTLPIYHVSLKVIMNTSVLMYLNQRLPHCKYSSIGFIIEVKGKYDIISMPQKIGAPHIWPVRDSFSALRNLEWRSASKWSVIQIRGHTIMYWTMIAIIFDSQHSPNQLLMAPLVRNKLFAPRNRHRDAQCYFCTCKWVAKCTSVLWNK